MIYLQTICRTGNPFVRPELTIMPCAHGQDAGTRGTRPNPATTGVYVGCVWQEYPFVLSALGIAPSVAVLTGSGTNFMVGRVSFAFGLQGEALPLLLHQQHLSFLWSLVQAGWQSKGSPMHDSGPWNTKAQRMRQPGTARMIAGIITPSNNSRHCVQGLA